MCLVPVSYIARSLSRIAFLILILLLWNTWMQDKIFISGFNKGEGSNAESFPAFIEKHFTILTPPPCLLTSGQHKPAVNFLNNF